MNKGNDRGTMLGMLRGFRSGLTPCEYGEWLSKGGGVIKGTDPNRQRELNGRWWKWHAARRRRFAGVM